MMKKIITLVLALAMAVSLFTGCGKKNNAETGESDPNKLSVVTTIFPEYDWVREILGGKAESTDLTMLLTCTAISPRRMTSSRFPIATSSSMWAASPMNG